MKGDFTRFTFRPEKHYTSVFMQQGRLQLDADWNEQISIQAYLYQTQVQDMIGAGSGTPEDKNGFRVEPTPDGNDLIIFPGRFYVGGALCELFSGNELTVTALSATQVQTPVLSLDGQAFAKGQWIKIDDRPLQISQVDPDQRILTFEAAIGDTLTSAGQSFSLSRITTYLTQPDYPNPPAIQPDTNYLIYLDVWQRHITALEDPDIREVALSDIPDTTTRVKTIWQVKLLPLQQSAALLSQLSSSDLATESLEQLPEWKALTKARSTALVARMDPKLDSITAVQALGNQLYRVEVHHSGSLNEASFKWSRDNGTVVSAIHDIQPQENAIALPRPARDTVQSFRKGQWIEVLDEVRELTQQPGTLAQIDSVIARAKDTILFNPATVNGDAIDAVHFPRTQRPKVRRWDQAVASLPVTADWIELENGIQIKFSENPTAQYQTGDYWLIPVRMNPDLPIDWPRDPLGEPILQPPLGIQHTFALLSFVKTQPEPQPRLYLPKNQADPFWNDADKRTLFPPLLNCLNKSNTSFPGPIGVGVKPPIAQLHVRGKGPVLLKSGKITTTVNQPTIQGAETKFLTELHAGDRLVNLIRSDGQTIPLDRLVSSVEDDRQLTVAGTIPTAVTQGSFTYQTPVLRLDTSDGQPQVVLSAQGNVGIGTVTPSEKVDVNGTVAVRSGANFVRVRVTDGAIGFESAPTNPTYQWDQSLTVTNGVINSGPGNSLQLRTQSQPRVTVSPTGDVAIGSSSTPGTLTVQGISPSTASLFQVKANTNRLLSVQSEGVRVGDATQASALQVVGTVAIARPGVVIPPPPNGLGVDGHIWAQNAVGINIDPSSVSGARLFVNGAVKVGDATNLMQITPPLSATSAVDFSTTGNKYHFDRLLEGDAGLTLTAGDLAVNAGSATISQNLTLTSGNLTVSQGTTTLANGLSVSQGTVTLGPSAAGQPTIVKSISSGTPVLSLQLNDDERVRVTPENVLVQLPSTINHPTQVAFRVVGQAAIGSNAATIPVPRNGLLIEGDVGIGISHTPTAKVDINSGDSQAIALRVKVSNQDRFSVMKDGDVIVNQRFVISPNAASFVSRNDLPGNGEDSRLWVDGKILCKAVRSDQLEVRSSRSLKDQILELSTQEVNEALAQLHPVKFVYQSDEAQTLHWGFIAEEVPEVMAGHDRTSISPVDIVAALTKAVTDQRQTIASLVRVVKQQQTAIADLTQAVNELRR